MPYANAKLIRRLYAVPAACDKNTMGAGYADDVSVDKIEADDQRGRARWIATDTFSKTGRQVRNVIDAQYVHTDRFALWRWAGMALG